MTRSVALAGPRLTAPYRGVRHLLAAAPWPGSDAFLQAVTPDGDLVPDLVYSAAAYDSALDAERCAPGGRGRAPVPPVARLPGRGLRPRRWAAIALPG